MSLTPETSDKVIDPRPCAQEAQERLIRSGTAESRPLPLISAHQVMLGTAAATAGAVTFDNDVDSPGEPTDEPVAPSRWMSAFTRRVRGSHERRPRSPYYPTRRESEFIADARMHREMYRL